MLASNKNRRSECNVILKKKTYSFFRVHEINAKFLPHPKMNAEKLCVLDQKYKLRR